MGNDVPLVSTNTRKVPIFVQKPYSSIFEMTSSVSLSPPLHKAHKSLLREDLLVLRHLFDLKDGQQTLENNHLEGQSLGSCIPGSNIRDLLFVSLDVENPPNKAELERNAEHQIGVSILDTRELGFGTAVVTKRDPIDILRTYQFVIGSMKYNRNASRSFCFGESQHI